MSEMGFGEVAVIAIAIGIVLLGIPLILYYRDVIDKETVLTILVGEMCLASLAQVVMTVWKLF